MFIKGNILIVSGNKLFLKLIEEGFWKEGNYILRLNRKYSDKDG